MENTIELMAIVKAGTKAAKERQKMAAENIAHANTTGKTPGADPYKRKMMVFKDELNKATGDHLVAVDQMIEDESAFIYKYEPSHPAADDKGYVKYPNVNLVVEKADFNQASISYKALLELMKEDKNMTLDTLAILDSN